MENFLIRDAREHDLVAITDIYNEAVIEGGSTADIEPRSLEQRRAWVESHTPRDKYPVVVVEANDGSIAGFASLSRFHPRPGYDGVAEVSYYVASQYRRHGIGEALLSWLEEAAQQRGMRKLAAIIFADNAASTALMRSHGFTQYGLLPDAARNEKLNRAYDVSYWYKNIDEK